MSGLGESQAAMGSSTLPAGLNVAFIMHFPVDKMTVYVMIIILLITISNIIAGRIVYGGDRYIFYLFATVLFSISGALALAAPIIVGIFFSIPTFPGV